MKLAVIDHILNPGGGTRVARSLLPAMKRVRPDLDITFFANEHGIRRDNLQEVLDASGIRTVHLRSVRFSGKDLLGLRGSRHAISLMQKKLGRLRGLLPFALSGALHQELERSVRGFDFAFFTWPFHLQCPKLSCPMAGIFHDFNYKYYFSGSALSSAMAKALDEHMPVWLERATPIVSTQFMKSEIGKFYPEFEDKVKVVEIAPMGDRSHFTESEAQTLVSKLGIQGNYILCPTQMAEHKNVGPLISAYALLKRKGYSGVLVFTGSGTEAINGKACAIGLEKLKQGKNVYGLGYVSNEEIDALIQCADVLVNPSLYEGGCGPGFDAWACGTPVAMSKIPPFLEHLEAHAVKAQIFDPRSPEDIAEKIEAILLYPQQTAAHVHHSKQAIAGFTWERSAQGYLNVFEEITTKDKL